MTENELDSLLEKFYDSKSYESKILELFNDLNSFKSEINDAIEIKNRFDAFLKQIREDKDLLFSDLKEIKYRLEEKILSWEKAIISKSNEIDKAIKENMDFKSYVEDALRKYSTENKSLCDKVNLMETRLNNMGNTLTTGFGIIAKKISFKFNKFFNAFTNKG